MTALGEELDGTHRLRAAVAVLELAGFRARAKAGVNVEPSGPTTPEEVLQKRDLDAELTTLLADLASPYAR